MKELNAVMMLAHVWVRCPANYLFLSFLPTISFWCSRTRYIWRLFDSWAPRTPLLWSVKNMHSYIPGESPDNSRGLWNFIWLQRLKIPLFLHQLQKPFLTQHWDVFAVDPSVVKQNFCSIQNSIIFACVVDGPRCEMTWIATIQIPDCTYISNLVIYSQNQNFDITSNTPDFTDRKSIVLSTSLCQYLKEFDL
jgi:hypothetical protein